MERGDADEVAVRARGGAAGGDGRGARALGGDGAGRAGRAGALRTVGCPGAVSVFRAVGAVHLHGLRRGARAGARAAAGRLTRRGVGMQKKAAEVIEGENLDILIGSRPLKDIPDDKKKEAVKSNVLGILKEK